MRSTAASIVVAILLSGGVHLDGQTPRAATGGGQARLVELINDQMIGWTVERPAAGAVTYSAGVLTVAEPAGWAHLGLTIRPGSAVSFDVRTTSANDRALVVVGAEGLNAPERGYAIAVASDDRPVHRDDALHIFEVNPATTSMVHKTSQDWTHYEILIDPNRVRVAIDDTRAVDAQAPDSGSGGWFGLRAEVGSVMLRNLRVGAQTPAMQGAALRRVRPHPHRHKRCGFGPWMRRFIMRVREHRGSDPRFRHLDLSCGLFESGGAPQPHDRH